MARKKASTQPSSATSADSAQPTQLDSPTPQPTQQERILAEANEKLGSGGQHYEALGSDAKQQWVKNEGLQEINGKYYQNRQLPSGEMALVEKKPPPAVLAVERGGSSQVSDIMFRGLEGETLALLRKVAFNPEAFTYFT